MISLTINGRTVEAELNQTILEAARHADITIPTLCYHKDLSPTGACRMCLVSVTGARGLLPACTTKVAEGMLVETDNEKLHLARKTVLELLLSAYYDRNYQEEQPDNELLRLAREDQLDPKEFMAQKPRFTIDSDPNPFIHVDLNKCILCTRCVRACEEVQGRFVWGLSERGFKTYVTPGADEPLLEARCESCGACVAYCPTGALSLTWFSRLP